MARPHQLEWRMRAVLDTARNRATPTLRSRLAGSAIMAALLIPLAGAEATVIPAGANRLPYFKPIEGRKGVDVSRTPGADNKVDVTLRVEDR
jgi:hypothetical protein